MSNTADQSRSRSLISSFVRLLWLYCAYRVFAAAIAFAADTGRWFGEQGYLKSQVFTTVLIELPFLWIVYRTWYRPSLLARTFGRHRRLGWLIIFLVIGTWFVALTIAVGWLTLLVDDDHHLFVGSVPPLVGGAAIMVPIYILALCHFPGYRSYP